MAVKMLKGTCPDSTHGWPCHAHLQAHQGIDEATHQPGYWRIPAAPHEPPVAVPECPQPGDPRHERPGPGWSLKKQGEDVPPLESSRVVLLLYKHWVKIQVFKKLKALWF